MVTGSVLDKARCGRKHFSKEKIDDYQLDVVLGINDEPIEVY